MPNLAAAVNAEVSASPISAAIVKGDTSPELSTTRRVFVKDLSHVAAMGAGDAMVNASPSPPDAQLPQSESATVLT